MIELINDDFKNVIGQIDDKSLDLIILDPPYGRTNLEWDKEFIFTPQEWKEFWRVLKKNGAVLIFGIEPYSSRVRASQFRFYKYDWYWEKSNPTGFLNAKKQPLRNIETISVFYRHQAYYEPQLIDKPKELIRHNADRASTPKIYGGVKKNGFRTIPVEKGYPKQLLKFDSCSGKKNKSFHPTEKPVELLKYLIKTYSNPGDKIADFFMGSGSTLKAAKILDRNGIGIEIEKEYFDIALKRIENNR